MSARLTLKSFRYPLPLELYANMTLFSVDKMHAIALQSNLHLLANS